MNILIIGGAYQGKRKFAESFFGLASNAFLDGAQMPLDGPIHKIAIDQTPPSRTPYASCRFVC